MHRAFKRVTLQANRWISRNRILDGWKEPHLMRRFLLGVLAGTLAFPVVILVVAELGLLPINANTSPTGWENAFSRMALNASVRRQSPRVPNPIDPTEEHLMAGMKLFKSDCAGCHGTPDTAGKNEADVILYPNAPQFALHPSRKPDYQLFWIVKGGIRYTGMFAWSGQFAPDASGRDVSDEKIWTIITFLTHLDSLPPAVNAEWRKKSAN
jgi:mono/diheme cytochrome c family protein